MIKFKVCPKCHGDLYLSEDQYGKYFKCMQCGYLKDIVEPRIDSSREFDKTPEKELEAA